MGQKRQLVQQSADIVADPEEMKLPGQFTGESMKSGFELVGFQLGGMPCADNHVMRLDGAWGVNEQRNLGDPVDQHGGRPDQHVLTFSHADLADHADQWSAVRKSQLAMEASSARPRAESLQVDAVAQHFQLSAYQSLARMENASRLGHSQESRVAIEISDRTAAEAHDVTQVRDARNVGLGSDRPRKAAHGKAIGVQEIRAIPIEQAGQFVAKLRLGEPLPRRVYAAKRVKLDFLRTQSVAQGAGCRHQRRNLEPLPADFVEHGQNRTLSAIERRVFEKEADAGHFKETAKRGKEGGTSWERSEGRGLRPCHALRSSGRATQIDQVILAWALTG